MLFTTKEKKGGFLSQNPPFLVLIDKNLKQYKANLHCHTNISDGRLTPLEVKELYKSHGYSVIAYTDHDIIQGRRGS